MIIHKGWLCNPIGWNFHRSCQICPNTSLMIILPRE